mmetsp:Transcript_297/g.663  ORF Transcript_297/g.663 Transcript_297/m.663 type:complete len:247 (-) Transcript_297:207-947(-)
MARHGRREVLPPPPRSGLLRVDPAQDGQPPSLRQRKAKGILHPLPGHGGLPLQPPHAELDRLQVPSGRRVAQKVRLRRAFPHAVPERPVDLIPEPRGARDVAVKDGEVQEDLPHLAIVVHRLGEDPLHPGGAPHLRHHCARRGARPLAVAPLLLPLLPPVLSATGQPHAEVQLICEGPARPIAPRLAVRAAQALPDVPELPRNHRKGHDVVRLAAHGRAVEKRRDLGPNLAWQARPVRHRRAAPRL